METHIFSWENCLDDAAVQSERWAKLLDIYRDIYGIQCIPRRKLSHYLCLSKMLIQLHFYLCMNRILMLPTLPAPKIATTDATIESVINGMNVTLDSGEAFVYISSTHMEVVWGVEGLQCIILRFFEETFVFKRLKVNLSGTKTSKAILINIKDHFFSFYNPTLLSCIEHTSTVWTRKDELALVTLLRHYFSAIHTVQ